MYEAFYKLTAKPFRLSPDPRFFFNSRGHKRALSYLRYGIKQGEGFIIITGDVGTGKTTLVSTLFQALERENIVGAQLVTTQMQADDLLKMVAAGFGLPFQRVGKAGLLTSLESFFIGCVQEGKRVLLVVDEAQGLPPKAIEELRMLSNFTYQGRSLLQSFLLGQREFRTTMRSKGFEQLRQRVIAAFHLRPLDKDETRMYVEHRLLKAGWKQDPQFTDDTFEGIHQFTSGVPRRINTLCRQALLIEHPAEPEVRELDLAGGLDQHVAGFDIPVDHARLVRDFQRAQDAARDRNRLVDGQGLVAPEHVRERTRRDVLHFQKPSVFVFHRMDTVQRHDVRAFEPADHPRLAQGALARADTRVRRRDHLERDVAPDQLVLGQVHDAERAASELPLDAQTCHHASGLETQH